MKYVYGHNSAALPQIADQLAASYHSILIDSQNSEEQARTMEFANPTDMGRSP